MERVEKQDIIVVDSTENKVVFASKKDAETTVTLHLFALEDYLHLKEIEKQIIASL